MCTRYIEDLRNPLIPSNVFRKYAKKIYPAWLQLGAPERRQHMALQAIRQEGRNGGARTQAKQISSSRVQAIATVQIRRHHKSVPQVQNGMHSTARLSEACSDAVRRVRGKGISRSTNQQVLRTLYEKSCSGVQSGRVQIPTRLMSTSPSLPQCNGANPP